MERPVVSFFLFFYTVIYIGFFEFFLVKLKIETEDLDKDNLPFISGGGLSGRYKFEQLHFHWGEGSRGSEHRIDGKQYINDLLLSVLKKLIQHHLVSV